MSTSEYTSTLYAYYTGPPRWAERPQHGLRLAGAEVPQRSGGQQWAGVALDEPQVRGGWQAERGEWQGHEGQATEAQEGAGGRFTGVQRGEVFVCPGWLDVPVEYCGFFSHTTIARWPSKPWITLFSMHSYLSVKSDLSHNNINGGKKNADTILKTLQLFV